MNTNKIKKYLDIAKYACYNSDSNKVRVGCVVVYKNKILSIGWNSMKKTNPWQKKYNKYRGYNPDAPGSINTVHAECHALSKIKKIDVDWSKVKIFVYRIKRNGNPGLSRPCEACIKFIKELGIRDIYYTTYDGIAHERIYK